MNNLIGITGKMGVGKSLAYKYLKHKLGESSVDNIRFSAPLYELQDLIYDHLGMVVEGEKDRVLLQLLGTDWARSKDKGFWVNIFKEKVLTSLEVGSFVLTDDARFVNEVEAIHALDGIIIKIVGPQRGPNISNTKHASEMEIDKLEVDYIVDNSATEVDLYRQIDGILESEGLI